MTRPLVVWITSFYPGGVGENFITAELEPWAASGARVVLLPVDGAGTPQRDLPPGVEVDERLCRRWPSRRAQGLAAARALVSPMLRRELADLRRRGRLDRGHALVAWRATAQALVTLDALAEIAKEHGPIDLVYTYWLKPMTAAAVVARDRGLARRVISRAHGTDLYEHARPLEYNALVRTVAARADRILAISAGGGDYLSQNYGVAAERVGLARLGVSLDGVRTGPVPDADDPHVRVLSISSLTPIKRLHLLVEALSEVARRRPDLHVEWTHAGDGPLRDEIEDLVSRTQQPNTTTSLLGQMRHDELLALLQQRPFDLMVNTSSSEGVPVSIMEAAARGIPCLATDVGATDEVVTDPRWLLPKDCSPEDIAEAILSRAPEARTPERREAVRRVVEESYDSATNFARFVDEAMGTDR